MMDKQTKILTNNRTPNLT